MLCVVGGILNPGTAAAASGEGPPAPATTAHPDSTSVAPTCYTYAWEPQKINTPTPGFVRGYGTMKCNNNLPSQCTTHVYLQQFSEYYKRWVNVRDKWTYACPPKVGVPMAVYSSNYNCSSSSPIISDWRTVIYQTWVYNGETSNGSAVSSDTLWKC